jgi:hypothetical protein
MLNIALSVIIPLVAAALLVFLVRRKLMINREEQIAKNEYETATSLWTFAKTLKGHMDRRAGQDTTVLDFTQISMPKGAGYRISVELSACGFNLRALPNRYSRTGRVSFYADNTLTVRALDRGGAPACVEDPEYMAE